MTEEERELYDAFKAEVENLFFVAQRLDASNHEIGNKFTGTPSERIINHLKFHNIPGFENE
jgi:hypothetical protein